MAHQKRMIEVAPIQDAVVKAVENGNSWSEICRELKWEDNRGKCETSRLQRAIGYRKVAGREHYREVGHKVKHIGTDLAFEILIAAKLDPRDFGL